MSSRADHRAEYDDVPLVAADAEPDSHWTELAATTALLPGAYMPPPMRGAQPPWRKAAAIVLITMLVTAASGGICLTYGPGELFAFFGA